MIVSGIDQLILLTIGWCLVSGLAAHEIRIVAFGRALSLDLNLIVLGRFLADTS